MTNTSPLLQCTDVRKAFPKPDGAELLVLEGMNLELREGQIVGLLGLSGSGKSTLLRLIAGLAEPTAGSVRQLASPIRLSATPTRRDRAGRRLTAEQVFAILLVVDHHSIPFSPPKPLRARRAVRAAHHARIHRRLLPDARVLQAFTRRHAREFFVSGAAQRAG